MTPRTAGLAVAALLLWAPAPADDDVAVEPRRAPRREATAPIVKVNGWTRPPQMGAQWAAPPRSSEAERAFADAAKAKAAGGKAASAAPSPVPAASAVRPGPDADHFSTGAEALTGRLAAPEAAAEIAAAAAPELAVQEPQAALVPLDPAVIAAAQAVDAGLPDWRPGWGTIAAVEEPWFEGRGFRFRVVYLDALGVTVGSDAGFEVRQGADRPQIIAAKVPAALKRVTPIYFHGAHVSYRVELEGTGDQPLDVAVFSRQEELNGQRLTPPQPLGRATLVGGKRAVVRGRCQITGLGGTGRINFEQTHVIVAAAGATGAASILADVAAAGVLDPPAP